MKVNIKGKELSYDGRRESLLVSYIAQNFSTKAKFTKKFDDELLGFIDLAPKMEPEHLVIVRWHAGYEFGHPMDYYGIGAIACKSIQPWKHHTVDHLIQHRNPFSKINGTLLDQITLKYNPKKATIIESDDSLNNYFLYQSKIIKALEKLGFAYKLSFQSSEEDLLTGMSSLENHLDSIFDNYKE